MVKVGGFIHSSVKLKRPHLTAKDLEPKRAVKLPENLVFDSLMHMQDQRLPHLYAQCFFNKTRFHLNMIYLYGKVTCPKISKYLFVFLYVQSGSAWTGEE